jgi:hypothetical protein
MVDFRKETIYFILIDRFFDGVPENNKGKIDEMFDASKTDWIISSINRGLAIRNGIVYF